MQRKTSIEAYHAIKNSGALSRLRWKVYDYIFHFGPCTQEDLRIRFNDQNNSMNPRFAELEKMEVLEIVGTAEAKQSGHKVNLWDVTANSTVKPMPKKPTRKELEEEIKYLKNELKKLGNVA